MAKYACALIVHPRTEATFSREEIEKAARISFYNHPPRMVTVYTKPEDLQLEWTDIPSENYKVLLVIGDVQSPTDLN